MPKPFVKTVLEDMEATLIINRLLFKPDRDLTHTEVEAWSDRFSINWDLRWTLEFPRILGIEQNNCSSFSRGDLSTLAELHAEMGGVGALVFTPAYRYYLVCWLFEPGKPVLEGFGEVIEFRNMADASKKWSLKLE